MEAPTEVGSPLLLQPQVGGCLSARWEQWQRLGAEPWIVEVLREGYQIPWIAAPPRLSASPIRFASYPPGSPKDLALSQEIRTMLEKDALEVVDKPGPGFYSRIFLVEKATGGWRPVIDLSPLSSFVLQTKFKMETVALVVVSVS